MAGFLCSIMHGRDRMGARRWIQRVVAAAGLLSGLAACGGSAHPVTAVKANPIPTLGSASYARYLNPGGGLRTGFGEVAPPVVDANGGDESRFRDIHWEGWGHAQTLGKGEGYTHGGPGSGAGFVVPTQLRATDLGRCPDGAYAYRQLWVRESGRPEERGWTPWAQWPQIGTARTTTAALLTLDNARSG